MSNSQTFLETRGTHFLMSSDAVMIFFHFPRIEKTKKKKNERELDDDDDDDEEEM